MSNTVLLILGSTLAVQAANIYVLYTMYRAHEAERNMYVSALLVKDHESAAARVLRPAKDEKPRLVPSQRKQTIGLTGR